MENNIKLIKIENLYPHPDNPRKDVGDVSELAESIKKNGIMQNLTVMPVNALHAEPYFQPEADKISLKSDFHVLIGHRRLAAAKLAGLTEMPCKIISKISKREQVSIMLEENMQRHDLTIYEQAQGFQMMLDLGETEESIAEKTGFSVSTVKRRINIAKLDQELLKEREDDDSFQLSLSDLYALEQVEDVKTRNKILRESNSSSQLKWKSEQAARDARRNKNQKIYAKLLKDIGVEEAPSGTRYELYSGKWERLKREFNLDKEPPKTITLKETKGVMWTLNSYAGDVIVLVKKAKQEKKKPTPEELAAKERDKNMKIINGKIKAMNKRAREFILTIIDGNIKVPKSSQELYKNAIWQVLLDATAYIEKNDLITELAGDYYYNIPQQEREEYRNRIVGLNTFEQMLLVLSRTLSNRIGNTYEYGGKYHKENGDKYLEAYGILEDMGWSFEDDELDILNGTSELYVKGDKKS